MAIGLHTLNSIDMDPSRLCSNHVLLLLFYHACSVVQAWLSKATIYLLLTIPACEAELALTVIVQMEILNALYTNRLEVVTHTKLILLMYYAR